MIYGHSQDLARAMPLIRKMRPEFWKTIDPDVDSARECAEMGVKLIVRHFGEWDGGEPEKVITSEDFVSECYRQPWWPYAWGIETPNEPHPGDADWMARVRHGFYWLDKECIVGNWGTGWDGFYVEGATWYSAHEYGWPLLTSQSPWHANRFQSWFAAVLARNPNARLLITECGVTQAVEGRQDIGWRTGPTAEDYWGSIQAYAAGLPFYVDGLFLYQVGGNPDWATFEVLDSPIEQWMAEQVAPSESSPAQPQGNVEEGPMDKVQVNAALDVIWGWTNPLVDLKADQAVKEIRDAVGIIKEQVGKA